MFYLWVEYELATMRVLSNYGIENEVNLNWYRNE